MAVHRDADRAVVAAQPVTATDNYTDLYAVDLTSGQVRNLTSTFRRAEIEPVFLANGDLLFTSGISTYHNNHQPNGL